MTPNRGRGFSRDKQATFMWLPLVLSRALPQCVIHLAGLLLAVQAKNRIDLHASRAAKRFCRSGLARDQPYRKSIARPQRFPTAAALPTPRGSHARSSDAAREVKP